MKSKKLTDEQAMIVDIIEDADVQLEYILGEAKYEVVTYDDNGAWMAAFTVRSDTFHSIRVKVGLVPDRCPKHKVSAWHRQVWKLA